MDESLRFCCVACGMVAGKCQAWCKGAPVRRVYIESERRDSDGPRRQFFSDVIAERARQVEKFPMTVRDQRPHLNRWERMAFYLKFIAEEVGEMSDAMEKTEGTKDRAASLPFDSIRKETVQVAALCLRLVEDEGL